jgi:hypothetical protein
MTLGIENYCGFVGGKVVLNGCWTVGELQEILDEARQQDMERCTGVEVDIDPLLL